MRPRRVSIRTGGGRCSSVNATTGTSNILVKAFMTVTVCTLNH